MTRSGGVHKVDLLCIIASAGEVGVVRVRLLPLCKCSAVAERKNDGQKLLRLPTKTPARRSLRFVIVVANGAASTPVIPAAARSLFKAELIPSRRATLIPIRSAAIHIRSVVVSPRPIVLPTASATMTFLSVPEERQQSIPTQQSSTLTI